MKGTLYLIPAPLGEVKPQLFLSEHYLTLICSIRHFAVEEIKTARRFLRKADPGFDIDGSSFVMVGKRSGSKEIDQVIQFLEEGFNAGLISEAGMPCVADPGAELVKRAHQRNISVVPIPGPSSILLALTASGMNGQHFTFHGYLPIQEHEKRDRIRELESEAMKSGFTQVFMETPYRNNALIDTILSSCRPETQLCIAADLTLETEYIRNYSIREWKKNKPDLHKRPAIFLISGGI